MSTTRIFSVALGMSFFSLAALATSPNRTALVVGNEHYESTVGPLRNTANDAKAIAKALRGLGFTVTERHDLTRDRLLRAMDDFRKTLPGAEVALFYYAGHGVAIGGSNYLVPIHSGFTPAGADDVTLRMMAETHLFNAEQAVADMSSAGAHCNLVILDACRSNRLPDGGRRRGAKTNAGLAEMTPPAGSLIAFSTDAGRTAFDGDGVNGLYTEELLKNLVTPGLTIEQVFKRTRAGVLQRSDGGQLPAEYSRLVGDDIYLAGSMRVAAALPVPTPTPKPDKTDPEFEADATRAADAGKAAECMAALRKLSARKGPGDFAAARLETLLEGVKNDLKNADAPSPRVLAAVATCGAVLEALRDCLPKSHARFAELSARAHNRRGDALLLLDRAKEALPDFDAAVALDPHDAYIYLNRGRARLALDQRDDAREDFALAMDPKFDQPKARALAERALVDMK